MSEKSNHERLKVFSNWRQKNDIQHDDRCVEVLSEADGIIQSQSGVLKEVRRIQNSFDLDL